MGRYSHFGLILLLITSITPTAREAQEARGPQRKLVLDAYGDLPLSFEPNRGQAAADVRFMSRVNGMTALLKDAEAVIITPETSVKRKAQLTSPLRMVFLGANATSHPSALEIQEGTSNYLVGNTPKLWHTSIPNFGRIHYPNLYPGIDLFFYGNHRKLEHDFVLAPGADYRQIRVRIEGAKRLSVNKDDSLHVAMPAGDLMFDAPQIYQYNADKKVLVAGHYLLTASNDNNFPIVVNRLTATATGVDAAHQSCPLTIGGEPIVNITPFVGAVVIGGNGSAARSLTITMSDQAPDACSGADFILSYSGHAAKANQ